MYPSSWIPWYANEIKYSKATRNFYTNEKLTSSKERLAGLKLYTTTSLNSDEITERTFYGYVDRDTPLISEADSFKGRISSLQFSYK